MTSISSKFGCFLAIHRSSQCILVSFENPIANVVTCRLNNSGSWNIIIKFIFCYVVCPVNIMDGNFLSRIIFIRLMIAWSVSSLFFSSTTPCTTRQFFLEYCSWRPKVLSFSITFLLGTQFCYFFFLLFLVSFAFLKFFIYDFLPAT